MTVENRVLPPFMPYPWQGEQWDRLALQRREERLPHGLLLNGPQYVGKEQFARALAQLVLCNQPVGEYACGHCKACKLFHAGSHPDLLVVAPEEQGKAIKVDQIRMLRNFLSKTAQQGGWKVVVVVPAEAMNVNAANALLKSLEEPSGNTLLILVSHQLSGVPATIRSRCRLLPFAVPSEQAGLGWLQQIATGDYTPEWLLQQASGRPLLALKLVESDLLERKQAFFELLEAVATGHLSSTVAAERCCKQPPMDALDWLAERINERIRSEQGSASSRVWFQYQDRMTAARRELLGASNPNPQLLWESLLMDWQALNVRAKVAK